MFSKKLFASLSALPDIAAKENWPLSSLTTLGTGGHAEFFACPDDVKDLQEILRAIHSGRVQSADNVKAQQENDGGKFSPDEGTNNADAAKKIPVYVLGGGSNIIIPDGEIPGLVISTQNFNSIAWLDAHSAEIGSGCKLSTLLKTLREKNSAGLEFAAGIPGTLGGAIIGNAGAGGRGVCELVESVTAIDASGNLRTYGRGEFSYSYRKCSLADEGIIIVSAKMTFRNATPEDEEAGKNFLLKRKNQPVKFRCAGCTFKNPERQSAKSAGQLLDECGCKNLALGGAIVSDQHANFILNRDNASSSDIVGLMKICAQKVYDSTGIKLEPEIKIFAPCFYV